MVTLSAEQEEVMDAIVKWYAIPVRENQVFYLAGYAGTGKSTIVETAIEALKSKYSIKKVVTAAYTGKAASVLQAKGIPNAMTIHRMLYMPYQDENGELAFVKRADTDAEFADLIVLDECSMIGAEIAQDIKDLKRKILVIGDPGQLPPINGESGFTTQPPDRFLKTIHRQAADSPIIELATMVREGKRLPANYEKGDVRVMPLNWNTREHIFREDTQAICGIHASRYNYTRIMREKLGYKDDMPQPGERIICCKTNYRWGFYNGYMGVMKDLKIKPQDIVDKKGNAHKIDSWYIDVKLEDMDAPKYNILIDPYLFQNHTANGKIEQLPFNKDSYGVYSEFDFSYIITCHKAQGSQFNHVTVIDDSGAFGFNKERWLYTALTRSVSGLTVLTRNY